MCEFELMQPSDKPAPGNSAPWVSPTSGKFDPAAAALADRHYSRRTVGSPQFMPPSASTQSAPSTPSSASTSLPTPQDRTDA